MATLVIGAHGKIGRQLVPLFSGETPIRDALAPGDEGKKPRSGATGGGTRAMKGASGGRVVARFLDSARSARRRAVSTGTTEERMGGRRASDG